MPIRPADLQYMEVALNLSLSNLGHTWPNPCVGCVIARDNQIVGRGATAPGGRPHAETIALAKAGAAAQGATAYVTLEPCSHHGKTPPCVDALIASGIKRVVIAAVDPDPRVVGQGIARLKQAGIEVVVGVGEAEASNIHAGFFKAVRTGMPLVTLKLATTRNGFLDTSTLGRRWITSQTARDHTHFLRAQYDAILVGIGTVLADDPMLNVRLPGYKHRSPVRVIIDSQLRLPPESNIVKTAHDYKTLIVTVSKDSTKIKSLREAGVDILESDSMELAWILVQLYRDAGITRVLVEGGFEVAKSTMGNGLADRIYWYRNHLAAGAKARFNVQDLGLEPQPYFLDYALDSVKRFPCDELSLYKKLPSP
ncbi:MAG: bifunctional diaminohydroxyphosphoribosylaminopyrimidine deaminase/5-amino-6-(5-phosphoribosylamino)uracil reductase RibD [Alphaproteobacteria bacterium]|nr:MAG: bifunctional diaminohydroxyphosphoribosylaminopyrimidine deaminase/5-amino-6-(5-phosphoribosylamino)uracil reductase RibD [Alphaproteobacteria bacterium]